MAQTEPKVTTLHSFTGKDADGKFPCAPLVQGSDGNLYGTTVYGGPKEVGTVFRLTPAGVLTTLHSFADETDGALPQGSLVQGSDGDFYGTTSQGSINRRGTIFKITPAGVFTTLHSFTGKVFMMTPAEKPYREPGYNKFSGADGAYPMAGLMRGSDGNYYGTTYSGGESGDGTVFKMTPAGALTVLHSFARKGTDGYEPSASLIQGSDGNFYGTTPAGGVRGCGTVFRITAEGVLTILHSFDENPGGGTEPYCSLVQGGDGNFYGTTTLGALNEPCDGTVFRITPAGVFTMLHSFAGSGAEGFYIRAGLVQGRDGNFYGTTAMSGGGGRGTVFQITPAGVLTTLYSFTGRGTDGADPRPGLIQASDGNFYGITLAGGSSGNGTVYRLSK